MKTPVKKSFVKTNTRGYAYAENDQLKHYVNRTQGEKKVAELRDLGYNVHLTASYPFIIVPTFFDSKRFVNIRGYVKEVTVLRRTPAGEYVCRVTENGKNELVPAHLFYHDAPGGLVMRDGPEFARLYPDFPIEINKVPSL